MRIAIDGRVMNELAGKGVYAKSVVSALAEVGADHMFEVFGYQPQDENWPSNFTFKPINGRRERLSVFRNLAADVLFSPSSYLTTLLSNVPVLTTIHDLVVYKTQAKLPLKTRLAERFLLRRAIRKSKALTVQNHATFNDLVEIFFSAKYKTSIIKPGIASSIGRDALPTEDAQRDIIKGLNIKGDYLLFVGTLEPRKNIVRLVEAYKLLSPELKNRYQLVLAGRVGWADVSLSKVLDSPPSGVVITGRVDNAKLATLYHHATLIAYPSLYEGVGYPILEGFYWGKPVLTSNVSSMKEVGGEAALLVSPSSVEDINKGLETLLNNKERRDDLAAKGQKETKNYSWAETARAYLAILETIA